MYVEIDLHPHMTVFQICRQDIEFSNTTHNVLKIGQKVGNGVSQYKITMSFCLSPSLLGCSANSIQFTFYTAG